jgi:hypothetical protein
MAGSPERPSPSSIPSRPLAVRLASKKAPFDAEMPLDHYDTGWLSSLSSSVSLDDLYMKFSLGSREDRISLMESIGMILPSPASWILIEIASFAGPELFAQLMLSVCGGRKRGTSA